MADPKRPTSVKEALARITAVKRPIAWKPGKDPASPARFWSRMELDALILSAPDHSGRPEEVAREVYHRLVARFVAIGAHKRQRHALSVAFLWAGLSSLLPFGLTFAAPILVAVGGEIGRWLTYLIGAIYLGTPIGLWIYASSLWQNAPEQMCTPAELERYKKEVEEAVQRCFLRGLPPQTPEDLADVWRHGWLNSDGRPIASEIVETDATSLAAVECAQEWSATCAAIRKMAALSLLPCTGFLILPLRALIPSGSTNPGQVRALELDRRRAVEGPLLVAAGGIEWSTRQENAWADQIQEARRDETPILHLGEATGILAGRGDSFAPSAGLPFDLSLRDLQSHLLVLGGTGSGKTSGVLRPLAHQIAGLDGVGLVIMDGKAALPAELRSLPGMRIVDPTESRLSLVGGLTPTEIVDTISDVLSPNRTGEDGFWAASAMGLLRRAAVIAHRAGGEWWTLDGIARIAVTDEGLAAATSGFVAEALAEDHELTEAVLYFSREWREMDAKTKSGIAAHARSWISTITAHPDLLAWARTEEGEDSFDILAPLSGGRIGFLVPAHRYARAGAVVTALLKARLYSGLKARADRPAPSGETPVVFLVDEAQEVATREDSTMLSIGRSLGLAMVGATQTVEGVTDALGATSAAKWLAVYGNLIALPGRSPATDAFAAERAGASWRAQVSSVPGISVRDAVTAGVFTGSVAASRRQATMREFASPAPSPVAPFQMQAQNARNGRQQASPDARMNREGDAGVTSTLSPHALVVPAEISTLLAEPNLALAVTTRARVPRRDVVKLRPRFD